MERVTVLVADDQPALRGAVVEVLSGQENVEVVGEASDGAQAVEMALSLHPQVVIMDLHPRGPPEPREIEVLRQIASGATNKEIAVAPFISENTVKTHPRNIMDKLHLANRSQAAAYAATVGLLDSPNSEPHSQ